MICPSVSDLLDAARERLTAELDQESHGLPFAPADGLVFLVWLAALASRLVTEERRADA